MALLPPSDSHESGGEKEILGSEPVLFDKFLISLLFRPKTTNVQVRSNQRYLPVSKDFMCVDNNKSCCMWAFVSRTTSNKYPPVRRWRQ